MAAKKRSSPAYGLVEYVWERNETSAWVGHKSDGLNQVMHQAVDLAIRANLTFALEDFERLYEGFRGGYWFGVAGGKTAMGESFYCTAVECGNESACKAFEHFAGRKPFKLDTGVRVALHDTVSWNGESCEVTSFPEGGVGLASYKREDTSQGYCSKVLHRYSVSLEEWDADMRARKAARTPPPVHTLVTGKDGKDYVVTSSLPGKYPRVELETVERHYDRPWGPKESAQVSLPDFRDLYVLKEKAPKLVEGSLAEDVAGRSYRVENVWKGARYEVPCFDLCMVDPPEGTPSDVGHRRFTYGGFLAAGFKLIGKREKKR